MRSKVEVIIVTQTYTALLILMKESKFTLTQTCYKCGTSAYNSCHSPLLLSAWFYITRSLRCSPP